MFVITNSTKRARLAFTLVELVVVIAILVTIAGLVIVNTNGILAGRDNQDGVRQKATRLSMERVRDAITGEPNRGFKQDMGEIPRYTADLFRTPTSMLSGSAVPELDLVHDRGWNGPYLIRFTGYYHVDPPLSPEPRGFTTQYGAEDDPALLDLWGWPIVLQIPTASVGSDFTLKQKNDYARLVSAGPNGRLETQPSTLAPDITHTNFEALDSQRVGDDLVLYLYRANGPGP